MRCLKLRPTQHLDGSVTYGMVVPSGNRRTKRRTRKKWIQRVVAFMLRQPSQAPSVAQDRKT